MDLDPRRCSWGRYYHQCTERRPEDADEARRLGWEVHALYALCPTHAAEAAQYALQTAAWRFETYCEDWRVQTARINDDRARECERIIAGQQPGEHWYDGGATI